MPKLRVSITFVMEYDADPADYLPGQTAQQMLEQDMQNAKDDPEGWVIETFSGEQEPEVTGEVVSS